MNNLKIASAVALALGTISAAQAAPPTLAQCQAPAAGLFVGGSSAAQNAFANGLATDLFGGASNMATYSASNGNFKAYCGAAIAGNGAGVPAGNIVVVHYRGEGGSVMGALPIVSGKPVKFLDLTSPSVTGTAVTTTGTPSTVGTTDGWGGPLTTHAVEVGVTDVEPGLLAGANYPTLYSTAVFGSATAAQLSGLVKTPLFQQVFGIFVNTTGINGGAAGQAINLTRDTVANILSGSYTDWSKVPSAGGGRVSSVAAKINLVNREAGSGSRATIGAYFLNVGCGSNNVIADPTPANDGYSTGEVLTTAAATSGAITYASIDNVKAGLSLASLSGVTPTNLAATSGEYDLWSEAQLIKGTITSPGGAGLYTWFTTELAKVATAPHLADNLAIPNVAGNVPAVPVVANTLGTGTIYINPFTKNNNTCSVPTETN